MSAHTENELNTVKQCFPCTLTPFPRRHISLVQ